jgi:predicted small secreted protein
MLARMLMLMFALSSFGLLAACDNQSPTEEAAEEMGEAMEDTGDAIEDAADEAEDQMQQ